MKYYQSIPSFCGFQIKIYTRLIDVSYANATVTCAKFSLWGVTPVVTPVATVTKQCTNGSITAVLAVSVKTAPAKPELAEDATNVVVPQPTFVGVARVPKVKVGIVIAMLSSIAIGTLRAKLYATEVGAAVYGLETSSALLARPAAGYTTAVDFRIAVAATSLAAASPIATVRAVRSSTCDKRLVVNPLATVTVHICPESIVAPAVVSINVAVTCPELEAAAVNVLNPHPGE